MKLKLISIGYTCIDQSINEVAQITINQIENLVLNYIDINLWTKIDDETAFTDNKIREIVDAAVCDLK